MVCELNSFLYHFRVSLFTGLPDLPPQESGQLRPDVRRPLHPTRPQRVLRAPRRDGRQGQGHLRLGHAQGLLRLAATAQR